MRRNWQLVLIVGLTFATVGCKGLNKEFTFEVKDQPNEITLEAVSKEQSVKVYVNATGGPVNVYVFLEKDAAIAKDAIDRNKISDAILKQADKIESDTLEVAVPANNALIVQVWRATGKSATVTVKLTN